MRIVWCLLISTFATAASATEWPLPRAPNPQEKSRLTACPEFGPGYFRVGDTTTCLKISGYVEADVVYHGGSGSGVAPVSKSSHGK